MDSICVAHFMTGSCPVKDCPNAHRLSDLPNPRQWVLFHAPGISMLDFLPYKYQSHFYFRTFPLPGTGPLVRFASPDDAETVAREFRQYYCPAHLPEVIAQVALQQNAQGSLERACHHGQVVLKMCKDKAAVRKKQQDLVGRGDELSRWSSDDVSSEAASTDSLPTSPVSSPKRNMGNKSRHDIQRPDRSDGIIGILRKHAAAGGGRVGWAALNLLWGIKPESLDEAVLQYLANKPQAEQEQILLSFAAIDLASIHNLSAYLNCLIKEHETTPQACLHFLAGVCPHGDRCRYIHPVGTAGWTLLETRWGITFNDFDYAVLNYLSKKPVYQQDEILTLFADMNLKTVKNRSAYLSSMIERYERVGLRKRPQPRTRAPNRYNHVYTSN